MKINANALRTRVREVLDCLDRGEPVTLTYRGKARAKLVRVDESAGREPDEKADLPAFGMWRDREDLDDVGGHVRRLREGRRLADRH